MMTWRICDVVVVRILARANLGGTERRLTTCVECPKLELAGTAAICNSTDRAGRDGGGCCSSTRLEKNKG